VHDNSSLWGSGGGTHNATLSGCTISGNWVDGGAGGGAHMCTLNACTVLCNVATQAGAGVGYMSTANDCLIASNSATMGGGADFSTLTRCTVADNIASNVGGGTSQGTINLCIVRGNRARDGGGTWNGTVNNCLITDNTAGNRGGGAYCSGYQYLNNCTLSANHASEGSAVYLTNGSVRNCIAYGNGPTNWAGGGNVVCCCMTPLAPGAGNISDDPQFNDDAHGDYRLLVSSPCVNAGSNAFVTWDMDLDNNSRVMDGWVDMGCYEYVPEPTALLLALAAAAVVRRVSRTRRARTT
jgi:hypothetical protein